MRSMGKLILQTKQVSVIIVALALSRNLWEFHLRLCLGIWHLKMASSKTSNSSGESSEQNSARIRDENSKIGALWFCNFSNLNHCDMDSSYRAPADF